MPRKLLQLDPEEPFARGSATVVDRQRLADDHRRFGGQKASLGLVDRPRHTGEPGREVNDRGACEAVVAVPTRWLREREVNLHLGAAETEALSGFTDLG